MAKPFDATTKALIDAFPQDWLNWLGLSVSQLTLLDSDLSAVSAAADCLIQFDTPIQGAVHLELQASHDANLLTRIHSYSGVARDKYQRPILTVLILLRKEANHPTITGVLRMDTSLPNCYDEFGYRVVRLWQERPETFLQGGLGTLPLAPLTDVSLEVLPQVVQATTQRIQSEAKVGVREELLQATTLLLGLKFDEGLIRELMKGVTKMKESSVYQAIFADGVLEGRVAGREEGRIAGREEGRVEGEVRARRNTILRLGRKRFGEPSAETVRWLESVATIEALDTIADRLLEVETWNELRG